MRNYVAHIHSKWDDEDLEYFFEKYIVIQASRKQKALERAMQELPKIAKKYELEGWRCETTSKSTGVILKKTKCIFTGKEKELVDLWVSIKTTSTIKGE